MRITSFKTLALAAFLSLASSKPAEDLIKDGKLPGFNDTLPSDTYSGYLNVSDSKALHYMFAESIENPQDDPVLIWFNGGPGCSSLLGFFQENGPVVVDGDGNSLNPFPWNQKANVLYLESPAGVGFTLSNNGTDLIYNDMLQSEDAYKALSQWYAKFPEFVDNKLWISGESYGGIYVPYLAWQVYQHNMMAQWNANITKYNLEGFLVGNGATNWDYDVSPSFPGTVGGFNLIPKTMWDEFDANNCTYYFNDFRAPSNPSKECNHTWD